jgi:bacillithiol biosynthesis cysteine-adding enzyme BshC
MSFKKTNISYKDSGLFSKTLVDYVGGEAYLKPFYEYEPTVKGFVEAIKKMSGHEYPRKELSANLKEYYTRNAPGSTSDATLKNIQKLEDKNCFTVTTGHQLCLFTGPLYFVFKIMTAINLAEKLNQEYPNNHFVPVYWMATEDHDFAEINHANLYGKKVEWQPQTSRIEFGTGSNGALNEVGGPVGKMSLKSLTASLDSLFAIMGEVGNTHELKQIISDSYSGEKTLGEATFSFVNALLGKYGLVIIEPDNAELKKVFAPVITDELLNESTFKLVSETNKKLVDAGVNPQVNPREINLFYIDEQGRNRIEKKDGQWSVVSGQLLAKSADEIKKAVNTSPEKFSPNVLLRPVYQQCILPNLAYIGGPSEIVYWLELKSTFEYYKIPYPVLMPRNTALIINNPLPHKMAKLNLDVKDLFKDTESLIKELMKRVDGIPEFEKESNELKNIYAEIGKRVHAVDPTLVAFTEAELQKQLNAFKILETKLMRVKKQKEETSIAQLRKIKDNLFPGGELQERTENFIPFYLQQGPAFFDLLKDNFDPFEFSTLVFVDDGN